MRAAGYARVSTQEQVQGGHSLDAQQEQIAAYCKARGWQLAQVFVDPGSSGKDLNRPGLQGLLQAVKGHEVDVVIAPSLDRLARRARDLLNLRDEGLSGCGVALVLLREGIDCTTPAGKMTFTVMAGAAELERDLLSERTRNGMAQAKKKGHVAGRVPFGWRREGSVLVKDAGQEKALRRARRLRRQGRTFREIAERMGWSLGATARRLANSGRRAGR
jgi:site-specific DNA recombinase